MIRVTAGPGCLAAKGHAGAGKKGRDLVCAGVSVLLITLAEYLKTSGADALSVTLEPGNADLRADGAAAAFAQTLTGLRLLAEAYPACVQVQTLPPEGNENH